MQTAENTMLITPSVAALGETLPSEAVPFAMLAAGEVVIGLMMGFVMTLAFGAIQVAGQIMDMQTGFGMMNVFNPALETQFPIFGFFFFIVAVLFLLVTYGHHTMIRALVVTYERIPLGGFVDVNGRYRNAAELVVLLDRQKVEFGKKIIIY